MSPILVRRRRPAKSASATLASDLLALLSEEPKYGLQLRGEFEAHTGEVWPLDVGQVYTTLQRLERDGLVAAVGDEESAEPGPQADQTATSAGPESLLETPSRARWPTSARSGSASPSTQGGRPPPGAPCCTGGYGCCAANGSSGSSSSC
jgi:DNA-binding PadR family transcriptional regulator